MVSDLAVAQCGHVMTDTKTTVFNSWSAEG
jgi:hypothetical protein